MVSLVVTLHTLLHAYFILMVALGLVDITFVHRRPMIHKIDETPVWAVTMKIEKPVCAATMKVEKPVCMVVMKIEKPSPQH